MSEWIDWRRREGTNSTNAKLKSSQSAFKSEEVQKIVNQVIESVLKSEVYDDTKVEQWVNDICEASIEKLYALKKPFKYIGWNSCSPLDELCCGVRCAGPDASITH